MEEQGMSGQMPLAGLQAAATRLRQALAGRVLGQGEAIDGLLIGYMARGHVLLEGLPGVGKTLLARSFAEALGLGFARVQFTPDVMPTDLIGTNVYDAAGATFRLVKGPIFTTVLMADEVNRTPPKTQSALLEAMQERQATIDGKTHTLPDGFFTIATQNPIEFEGTYPLPEAQLDRFLLRLRIGYPDRAQEMAVYSAALDGTLAGWMDERAMTPVMAPGEASALRLASRAVHVAPELVEYLAALVAAVRQSPHLDIGVSPRGGLSLLEASRAAALLEEREFVLPDDLKRWLVPCWGHRLLLRPESELEGLTTQRVLEDIARAVPVPKAVAR
jgi:MoxR-like ATPase